ncbi:TlpA family protein disulfide reductase [Sphingomonas adhaesiva]|uniref:TlpA family protein disulfide reductase n=1 Tax=Sphingomonas adhaesiva TaxID=28212 RepID=UPI002FF791C1
MTIRWSRAAMLLVPLLVVLTAQRGDARRPALGEMAPAYTLKTFDGRTVTSDQLRGKVVILNYWATWCAPCREELPLLDTYYRLQERHGLRVFAATTEDSVPAYRLKPLFAAMHIVAVKRMVGSYADIDALPTNYVIDRNGRIRYARAGAFTLDTLNEVVVPLLNEPAPDGTSATE